MDKISIADAIGRLANTDFARLLERKDFDLSIYRPAKVDPQKPHLRDELYVVAAGSGEFLCSGETRNFGPGDLFFVPAGAEHRFLNFSDDFATWVIFFGPTPN